MDGFDNAGIHETNAQRSISPTPGAPFTTALDPFDPERLRLPQDFGTNLGVTKALLTVPVRKPTRDSWFRVNPAESYSLVAGTIELKERGETYLVAAQLINELGAESTFAPRKIFTAITKQNALFLFPVRLANPDGRVDHWSASLMQAAEMSKSTWTRTYANMGLGAYEVVSSADETVPRWPDISFTEILRIAFKDRFIDSLDHLVLRELRGDA